MQATGYTNCLCTKHVYLKIKHNTKKANSILTSIIKEALKKNHISKGLYEAISQFQLQVNEKQSYLAYWARKSITMSFDGMTTSPVESINCHKTQKQSKCHFNLDLMFLF
jgi:hypothetical protein